VAVPGTDDFRRFVQAYFGERITRVDTKSKANHIVFHVKDHWQNISVPSNRPELRIGTFLGLLEDIGLSHPEFLQLAGTPDKLKAYCKHRKGEAGG
jgi:hypothetical protein